VVALRTPTAKYATYSNFAPGSIREVPAGREVELYDYSTAAGRMELDNVAGESELEAGLSARLRGAIRDELRAPLPSRLYAAHKRGVADYFKTAGKSVVKATERRRERSEREVPGRLGESPFGEVEPTTRLRRRPRRRPRRRLARRRA
jgi:hypothetical protein